MRLSGLSNAPAFTVWLHFHALCAHMPINYLLLAEKNIELIHLNYYNQVSNPTFLLIYV